MSLLRNARLAVINPCYYAGTYLRFKGPAQKLLLWLYRSSDEQLRVRPHSVESGPPPHPLCRLRGDFQKDTKAHLFSEAYGP